MSDPTKGPWKWELDDDGDYVLRNTDVAWTIAASECQVCDGEESEDMKLIARAPELLKENEELKESLAEAIRLGVKHVNEKQALKKRVAELEALLKECLPHLEELGGYVASLTGGYSDDDAIVKFDELREIKQKIEKLR